MNFPLPPDCPYYLISRATLAVTSALKKGLVTAGVQEVKPAYLGVLIALWQDDNLKANELGKRAGLEPSTMTGLLDRMEKDNLLRRHPDPHDRRASRIQLTRRGVEAEGSASKVVTNILGNVLNNIDQKDIDTTKNVLRQILINCGKEGAK
jgi:DNA-binding MarR family transcriptional regulator